MTDVICTTDLYKDPVFADYLAVRDGSSAVVDDPEECRKRRLAADATRQVHVTISATRYYRRTVGQRTVYNSATAEKH